MRPLNDAKLAYPLEIIRLAGHFRRESVQVVNTHSSRDGWMGGIAGRLARVPLIIRSRHIEVDYPNRRTSRVAFHHLPDAVITTSARISRRLVDELGLDPDRVVTVPTGIDLQEFSPRPTGTLRKELGLSSAVNLVGMISVLRSWKGHEYFLAAAQQLLEQRETAQFLIAGDGPGRATLQRRLEEPQFKGRVHWLGHREDVANVLSSLDVVVLPSTAHEGIPQILLQAQAMERAVVASRVGGIPEIVADGETGLLVDARQPDQLAERIRELLHNPGMRDRLGRQARGRVVREHSLETMCGRLEAVYQRYRVRSIA